MPNPAEVASIVINGQEIRDWETVWVHLEYPSRWRSFRFSVSEFDPHGPQMQIKPGMVCTILLGGVPVITAYVIERQAYYDANRHTVMISGQSKVSDLTGTSVIPPKQYTNQTLQQIAQDVCKPFGIGVTTRGDQQYMSLPFDNAQVMISESPYQFIERLSRMRACFLADDVGGNLVLDGGGDFAAGPAVVEGQNIKWARATITDLPLMDRTIALGEAQAMDDSKWAKDVTQPKAQASPPQGWISRYKPLQFVAPRALGPKAMMEELKAAAAFEVAWQIGTALRVEVGVQGWFAPGGKLWDINQLVDVYSPMLPVTEPLITEQITFTQSIEEGTNTVLELVNEAARRPTAIQA
jgi:prophage tail gpP-like protein